MMSRIINLSLGSGNEKYQSGIFSVLSCCHDITMNHEALSDATEAIYVPAYGLMTVS